MEKTERSKRLDLRYPIFIYHTQALVKHMDISEERCQITVVRCGQGILELQSPSPGDRCNQSGLKETTTNTTDRPTGNRLRVFDRR